MLYYDVFGNKISKSQYREMVNAQRNRRELRKAGLMNRRDLMKMGLLTSMGTLIPKRGLSSFMLQTVAPAGQHGGGGGSCPQQPASPATTPFVQPLNIMPQKKTTTISALTVGATPSIVPNNAAGEGRLCQHQSPIGSNSNLPFPAPNIYEIWQQPGTAVISPTYGNTSIWGFSEPDGPALSPGPTYVSYYGSPNLVRNVNKIPASAIDGFGINQVTTHLHNGHTPSESDGNPCDFFPNPSISAIANATYYDQYYANALAGFLSTNQPTGDVNETLSSLWYHDHHVGYTAPNVYHGLAGFYVLFSSNPNEYDTGNELTGFHLPTYPTYDIPMMFADRVFDGNPGELFFDEFNFDGILGDQFLVNGNIQPYLVVSPRRYRFRWLNTGPSRFYQIYLTNLNNLSATNNFWQISNGGNLLPNPVQVPAVMIGVSNRHDVIIDFSQYAGQTLYLENRLQQVNGRGPTGNVLAAGTGNLLLQIQVTGPTVADNSVNPATNPSFFALPSTNVTPLVQRKFDFNLTNNGEWVINGQLMAACPDVAVCGGTDNSVIRFQVTQNSVETWEIKSMGGGQPPWTHPIHIHLEEFQILKNPPPSLFAASCNSQGNHNNNNYNDPCSGDTFCGDYSGRNQGQGPTGVENGRNDVLEAVPGTDATLFFRFRDWLGKYPMHCHNVVHEDHAMMLLWEVAVQGDNNQNP